MIQTIAVIGAGTMGHGIAESFALAGLDVRLYDVNDEALAKARALIADELQLLADEAYIAPDRVAATLARIATSTDLAATVANCDYVIEAAPEKIELKHDLLARLDALAPAHAIIASNTSSLPLEAMATVFGPERKSRFMVCHWYNPGHLMPIVELSFFGNMSAELYAEVEALYGRVGKQTVKVLKDVPGLVANRIQQGVAREVFSLIERGIASPADIDKALKFGPAFRYATTGQLEVADFGGLDIWCVVGDNLLKDMDNSKEANPVLRTAVAEGKLGLKSGEGFFRYPPEEAAAVRRKFMRKLIHQLKASAFYV
ncbi:3-hydroxyacyl-CoA dehydrogenase family protein [Siculibacillus lacustris]|uniref:3-hydroxyacyl-CoA dehydrogenase family protein n=1 Tax=Siculibacillus lacustris TaxID=1549641 RepID=A0A4V2KU97_9HYPH|nr:3-hydroxyacyl-CoA dehydrogenase NAD-binding domain-containing protein [Siculibacillus lacustris]TBW40688.1 3-hydroxyacyl-CoA dehydrogenase family protein [Siculibacillus lacustris]